MQKLKGVVENYFELLKNVIFELFEVIFCSLNLNKADLFEIFSQESILIWKKENSTGKSGESNQGSVEVKDSINLLFKLYFPGFFRNIINEKMNLFLNFKKPQNLKFEKKKDKEKKREFSFSSKILLTKKEKKFRNQHLIFFSFS